jgi:hypothetical protein
MLRCDMHSDRPKSDSIAKLLSRDFRTAWSGGKWVR